MNTAILLGYNAANTATVFELRLTINTHTVFEKPTVYIT